MADWDDVGADLIITDPPFGIDFDGQQENYNRDSSNVVEGYIEWSEDEYRNKIDRLLQSISRNLKDDGQCLIFSGWNNSHLIHELCSESSMNLRGKMYWEYNFAPYCKNRPAHNVYEIFWLTKGGKWTYNNSCSYEHCTVGESNLSSMDINRDYHKNIPKYPTRLPSEVIGVLIEHYSEEGDLIFDPLAGSGMVGIVSDHKNRDAILGDLNEEAMDVYNEIRDKYKTEDSGSVFDY